MLEKLVAKLVEMWPTLVKYFVHEKLMGDKELNGVRLEHLARAIKNEEGDMPGIECMLCGVQNVTRTVGENARRIRGCHCHASIMTQNVSPDKRKKLMIEAGCPDGFCCLAGRNLNYLIHGGLDECTSNVEVADSVRFQQVLTAASPTVPGAI